MHEKLTSVCYWFMKHYFNRYDIKFVGKNAQMSLQEYLKDIALVLLVSVIYLQCSILSLDNCVSLLFSLKQCIHVIKQLLLDSFFVISGIIKVSEP